MRWLVAHPGPGFSVADVFTGWVEGLREVGEQVHIFDLDARLCFYDAALLPTNVEGQFRKALPGPAAVEAALNGLPAALFKLRPDVLLLVSAFFYDADLLDQARATGTRVVLLATESPYEDDRQLKVAEHCDLVLLNDPLHLARFEAVVPTVYAPHAYRPAVHHPGSSKYPPCDFAFVGTGYPSRQAFLEAMDLDGLDVVLGGNWQTLPESSPLRRWIGHEVDQCTDNDETADLYRAAAAGINLYRRELGAVPGLIPTELAEVGGLAMGPREVEMAASGLWFLRDPRPEGDQVLPMLPTFRTPGEAGELLRWHLAHPDVRQRAADNARAAVADRTFAAHAARLLRLFDRQPVSI
jgi:spore maturation protein CgeB